MHGLTGERVRQALITETWLLADLYRDSDPDTPVPTCPGWTVTDLVAHVGGAHHWAAELIRRRSTDFVDYRTAPNVQPPREQHEVADWLSESARSVLSAVDVTGPDVSVWTPFGGHRPARWWIRRRLHEATGHRADALIALGREVDVESAVAADGLSELLDLLTSGSDFFRTSPIGERADTLPLGGERSVALIADDCDMSWSITFGDTAVRWASGCEPADAAVTAGAAALYLTVLRRLPTDSTTLGVRGDITVLTRWLERAVF